MYPTVGCFQGVPKKNKSRGAEIERNSDCSTCSLVTDTAAIFEQSLSPCNLRNDPPPLRGSLPNKPLHPLNRSDDIPGWFPSKTHCRKRA